MSNRFLLATTGASSSSGRSGAAAAEQLNPSTAAASSSSSDQDNGLSVDADFDSYWEEEARNPHRNRIRIGRQYQATVPPLLKNGDKDQRKLEELETLSFCPKKSARVSDAELDHYFTVAKSLNLFASLVETRSLLGRDVTIADLNHIRRKEGLSLASVIQPIRPPPPATATTTTTNQTNVSPPSSQQSSSTANQANSSSPTNTSDNNKPSTTSSSSLSCKEEESLQSFNQPLMKALSHFISLHHPCQHDQDCKKMLEDIPLEDDSGPAVSITAGNLRQGSSSYGSKETKPGRSRSSLKSQTQNIHSTQAKEEATSENNIKEQDDHQVNSGDNLQSPTYEDWTREEVELFSKAIEVCGKNFSSIKKEFLPSKSVRSIVEYYYIGSRDVAESKKKQSQPVETNDSCSSPEKASANNNGQGGGSGGGSSGPSASSKSSGSGSGFTGSSSSSTTATSSSRTTTTTTTSNSSSSSLPNQPNRTLSSMNGDTKQTCSTSNSEDVQINKTSVFKHQKQSNNTVQDSANSGKAKAKNIDARMSVYNFDEELKEESPIRFDCPRPGAEVKPLKAKPIIPNASMDSDATNSNLGSLKFFMDGQLVLKLNACQEQQEGIDKCHWVQSGDKVINATRQKRYTKRSDRSSDINQNGSQSNSVISSFQDDDSKNDDLTGDEDSKESMSSFTNLPHQQQKNNNNNHGSPIAKRAKIKNEPNNSLQQHHHQQQQSQQQQGHLPSPINYNRLAVNNRIKERNDNNLNPNPEMSQAMPWLQANSFALAAALLSGLPFPPTTGNMIDNAVVPQNNASPINVASKPMDLSLEHRPPKAAQKSSNRSGRSRPKNA